MKDLLTSEVVAIGNEIRILGSEEMLAYTGETEATQAVARERAAYIAQALNERQAMLKALQDSNLRVEVLLDTMSLEQQLKASLEVHRRQMAQSAL